uniref:CNNM transmembrane domain-containing protein n=1 Tax=Parastrongyloides trichosuri TaxID=131310 RepID=A0A0N4Z0S1_PARTI
MKVIPWLLNVISVFYLTIYVNAQETETVTQQRQLTPSLFAKPMTADGMVNQPIRAFVSGLRVEPHDIASGDGGHKPNNGYAGSGISLVEADEAVRVVLFGWWLDELAEVVFTDNNNCSSSNIRVPYGLFDSVTNKRLVVEVTFPESPDYYKLCIKQKDSQELLSGLKPFPYFIVDDVHAYISTNIPDRQYILPFWIEVSVISVFLVLSGLFSGLNLGLMALTPQELMLIQKSGSKTEKKYAEAIIPIRKSGNLLLCSLLIGNVCVNSAISILMDDLTSGIVALIASSAGIVIFGEIFPQSLCVKKGLAVGARTIWITRFFMMLTFPLAYPISKVLDFILGDEVVSYDRKRLMELIKLTTRNEAGLAEELKIAVGAMEISDKTVKDVMTKIDDVFMLPDTTVLNAKSVTEILNMGYTRIPIFTGSDKHNVVALLFVKDLALMDPDDNFTVKTVCAYNEHVLRFVMEDTPLRVMLEEFKKGDYHLAMVQKVVQKGTGDPTYELSGLVTLEDIVEEILQAEIVDETDVITDNVHKIRRRKTKAKDLTNCFLDINEVPEVISMQLQMVAVQFLSTNHPAFYSNRISQHILSKLIKQNVHKVDLTQLQDIGSIKTASRKAKLYTAQEPSDRYILILEGRVMVTIGKDSMTFEAGPWHCLGKEVLDKLLVLCPPLDGEEKKSKSLGNVNNSPNPGQRESISNASDKNRLITFIPDYTAVVRDTCTYLDITASAYVVGYKTSLLQREGGLINQPLSPTSNGDVKRSSLNDLSSITNEHRFNSKDNLNKEEKISLLSEKEFNKQQEEKVPFEMADHYIPIQKNNIMPLKLIEPKIEENPTEVTALIKQEEEEEDKE